MTHNSTRKKRFFYMETARQCIDPDLGEHFERYLCGSLWASDRKAFEQHLSKCSRCSIRFANHQNLQAAMEYHRMSPDQLPADPRKAAELLELAIVDLTGVPPMPQTRHGKSTRQAVMAMNASGRH